MRVARSTTVKRIRSVTITLAALAVLPACDAVDASDETVRSACEPGLQLELDPATDKPAANADGTLVVKYYDAQGGECYEQLECCDVVTLGCFCADTEHGAKCPSGSINPNVPSNGSSGD